MKYAGNKCNRVNNSEIVKKISKKIKSVKMLNVFGKNPDREILGSLSARFGRTDPGSPLLEHCFLELWFLLFRPCRDSRVV